MFLIFIIFFLTIKFHYLYKYASMLRYNLATWILVNVGINYKNLYKKKNFASKLECYECYNDRKVVTTE